MRLDEFAALCTPFGQQALAAAQELLPRESGFLQHFQLLSKRFPPELARAALETAILRREAQAKFPFGERLYLTREALEQASSWAVASYRANRYRPFSSVADLGCSIGGDLLALAQQAPALGLDADALRLGMAQANARAQGLEQRIFLLRADLRRGLPLSRPAADLALFFDPARRTGGRRLISVRAYQPPLALVKDWLPRFPALGVKLSPGVSLEELQEYDAELEFISLGGELKEAVLWFGPLGSAYRRATLLPDGHSLTAASAAETAPGQLPVGPPRAYLYEPDPAVLRAGLVAELGRRIDAAQLDAEIAYLTAERFTPTPFARAWQVDDWLPFQLKRLRAYLRERGVGRVTVKKRGSPLQPEQLIHALRLRGDQERLLFLTHLQGQPVVLVSRQVNPLEG